VATHPDAPRHSGAYLVDCNPARPTAHGRDEAMAKRLWEVSEEIAASV
jgi:hypothetical protein